MRILILGPFPPPLGGMAVQGALLERKIREEGLEVRRLRTNPALGPIRRIPLLRTLAAGIVHAVALPVAILRADVVHVLAASGFYYLARVAPAVLLGRLAGRRVVVNYRGGLAGSFFARHGWWADRVLRLAHAVTVPSAFLGRVFAARGIATVEVPNITDLDRFTFRERAALAPRLLVNRNFEPIYNVGLAVEAFARVRARHSAATLTLAGEGPEEASLRARVAALGLGDSVAFPGRIANDAMPALYDAHDVWLNPTDVDNMPVSVLECLASGLPVVSTSAGGVPDLVTHEREALLVPPRDPEAMAAAALRLLDDPALARRLAAAGRSRAAAFGWAAVRPRLLSVYGASN